MRLSSAATKPAGKVGLKALREGIAGYGEQKTLTIEEALEFVSKNI